MKETDPNILIKKVLYMKKNWKTCPEVYAIQKGRPRARLKSWFEGTPNRGRQGGGTAGSFGMRPGIQEQLLGGSSETLPPERKYANRYRFWEGPKIKDEIEGTLKKKKKDELVGGKKRPGSTASGEKQPAPKKEAVGQ